MSAGAVFEQVPKHELHVVDDGIAEKVELSVQLPGVASAADIVVRCARRTISVSVPGRYNLALDLSVDICDRAESVKFVKKKETLKAKFIVISAAAAASSSSSGASSSKQPAATNGAVPASSSNGLPSSNNGAAKQAAVGAAAAPPVHESFYPQPTKAELRQKQLQEQRKREAAAAAAAAAAEAERQRQLEQQRKAEAAARLEQQRKEELRKKEEALRRKQQQQQRREEHQRKEREEQQRKREAAAAAERQRQQQQQQQPAQQQQSVDARQRASQAAYEEAQQRVNREAAEAWLRRGLEAVSQGNAELAAKALSKVQELHPPTNTAQLQHGLAQLAAAKQQQQQPSGRQAPPAGASSTSSSTANSSSGQQQQQQQKQQQPQKQQQQQQKPQQPHQQQQQQQQQKGGSTHRQQQQQGPGARPGSSNAGSSSRAGGRRRGAPGRPPPAAAPPGPGSSSSDDDDDAAAGPPPLWEDEEGPGSSGEGGSGPVAWWCEAHEKYGAWLNSKADQLNAWSCEPGRSRVAYWAANLTALAVVGVHFLILLAWRTGWLQPLHVAAYIRRVGGDSMAESRLWTAKTAASLLERTTAAAAAKAMLFSMSAGVVLGGAWLVLLAPLGRHSAVGWCFAALWWVWRALVWHPWHSVQLPLAVLAVVLFGVEGPGCSIAVWCLQMLLQGGGWLTIASWLLCWLLNLGLLPKVPRFAWTSASAISYMLLACGSKLGAWGVGAERWAAALKLNPVRLSWWWWGVLLVLHVLVSLIHAAAQDEAGSSSSSKQRDDYYDSNGSSSGGFSDLAFTKYVMGFGSVAVPDGCEVAEVREVLQAKDYYQVMGFSSREACTPETLKAARRVRALAVHPDKVGHDHPGANLAAGRVNKAFETLSSAESRAAYDRLLDYHSTARPAAAGSQGGGGGGAQAAAGSRGAGSSGGGSGYDYVPAYREELFDRDSSAAYMTDMDCPACQRCHTVYVLPKAPFGVRWCRECGTWHPVKGGEMWAHWSPGWGGLSVTGRARILMSPGPDAPTLDVTDVIKCMGRIPINSAAQCNTHRNPMMEMFKARGGGGGGGGGGDAGGSRRSRKKQGKRR